MNNTPGTLYLMNYVHGFVFCSYVMSSVYVTHLPIFFRVASLELGQSYDCPNASEVILKDMCTICRYLKPQQNTTKYEPFAQFLQCDFQLIEYIKVSRHQHFVQLIYPTLLLTFGTSQHRWPKMKICHSWKFLVMFSIQHIIQSIFWLGLQVILHNAFSLSRCPHNYTGNKFLLDIECLEIYIQSHYLNNFASNKKKKYFGIQFWSNLWLLML